MHPNKATRKHIQVGVVVEREPRPEARRAADPAAFGRPRAPTGRDGASGIFFSAGAAPCGGCFSRNMGFAFSYVGGDLNTGRRMGLQNLWVLQAPFLGVGLPDCFPTKKAHLVGSTQPLQVVRLLAGDGRDNPREVV